MDHGGSRYHGDDRQGVPLTDGIIATSDALKRKEGEHEQMLSLMNNIPWHTSKEHSVV